MINRISSVIKSLESKGFYKEADNLVRIAQNALDALDDLDIRKQKNKMIEFFYSVLENVKKIEKEFNKEDPNIKNLLRNEKLQEIDRNLKVINDTTKDLFNFSQKPMGSGMTDSLSDELMPKTTLIKKEIILIRNKIKNYIYKPPKPKPKPKPNILPKPRRMLDPLWRNPNKVA
jgi:hypothetical protein